jgi:hypothetical protein
MLPTQGHAAAAMAPASAAPCAAAGAAALHVQLAAAVAVVLAVALVYVVVLAVALVARHARGSSDKPCMQGAASPPAAPICMVIAGSFSHNH